MNLPDTITVTFSEEARQSADAYCCAMSCLIATQLGLDGYPHVREGVFCTAIDDAQGNQIGYYTHEHADQAWLCGNKSPVRPHYGPEVVGKTLVLTKVK